MYRADGPAVEAWTPTVDIQRSNGDLVITAELPGLKKEEVKVDVTDDALIIEGERKREHKIEQEGYYRYDVRSWAERNEVEHAAWATPGVSEVIDHISVVP